MSDLRTMTQDTFDRCRDGIRPNGEPDYDGEICTGLLSHEIDALLAELSSAKAAFRELAAEVYQREASYRAVIDGIEDWLQEHSSFSATATMALTELRRVKFSALSGLRSLPPPDPDSPSTSPITPPA